MAAWIRLGQRVPGFRRGRARLRILGANPQAARRYQNPPALQQSRKSTAARVRRYPRAPARALPAAHLPYLPALPENKKIQARPPADRALSPARRVLAGGHRLRFRHAGDRPREIVRGLIGCKLLMALELCLTWDYGRAGGGKEQHLAWEEAVCVAQRRVGARDAGPPRTVTEGGSRDLPK